VTEQPTLLIGSKKLPLCPICGSVLSAVTFTCVRGVYCSDTKSSGEALRNVAEDYRRVDKLVKGRVPRFGYRKAVIDGE
jgi:hypothetical protein